MSGQYINQIKVNSCSRLIGNGKCRPWHSPLQSCNLSMVNTGNERITRRTYHLSRSNKDISCRTLILLPVIQLLLKGVASLGHKVNSEDSTSMVQRTSSLLLWNQCKSASTGLPGTLNFALHACTCTARVAEPIVTKSIIVETLIERPPPKAALPERCVLAFIKGDTWKHGNTMQRKR